MHKHVMLFDDAEPYAGGHHSEYIQYVIERWLEDGVQGRLDVVISKGFVDLYPQLAGLMADGESRCVNLVPLDDVHTRREHRTISGLFRSSLEQSRVLAEYVNRLRPQSCMLMYFDHLQASFAFGMRFNYAVGFAGIYFRPSFHYGRFGGALSWRDRIRQIRQKALLFAAMRNPHLRTLFCLDPYSVPHVRRLNPRVEVLSVPDPVRIGLEVQSLHSLRSRLGVEPGRRVLLMFGVLARRKGTLELLRACGLLPEAVSKSLSLLVAGPIPAAEAHLLRVEFENLRRSKPLQLVVIDRLIDEAEVQGLFRISHLVLLPYQRHVGSSGVLVRAAAAGVPVLGSDYGLLGEQIRRRRLGVSVNSESPQAIADGIARCLCEPSECLFDAAEAGRFARENSAEGFASAIFPRVIGAEAMKTG